MVPFHRSGAEDDAALAALNFDAATWNDVAAVAIKNHVTEVGLVQALYANGKMTVNIRRLGVGEQPAKTSVDVPMLQTVGTTYPAAPPQPPSAPSRTCGRRARRIDFSKGGRLTANVSIASLAQWGAIQNVLATVDNITSVTVNGHGYRLMPRSPLPIPAAPSSCATCMGGAGLTLAGRGGQWVLALAMNGGP